MRRKSEGSGEYAQEARPRLSRRRGRVSSAGRSHGELRAAFTAAAKKDGAPTGRLQARAKPVRTSSLALLGLVGPLHCVQIYRNASILQPAHRTPFVKRYPHAIHRMSTVLARRGTLS